MNPKTLILLVSAAVILTIYGAYILAVLLPIANGQYADQECFHAASNGTLVPGC